MGALRKNKFFFKKVKIDELIAPRNCIFPQISLYYLTAKLHCPQSLQDPVTRQLRWEAWLGRPLTADGSPRGLGTRTHWGKALRMAFTSSATAVSANSNCSWRDRRKEM